MQPATQKLVERVCIDPPRGWCHGTLPLLTDARVVLGLVEASRRETARQALKKLEWQNQLEEVCLKLREI